MAGTKQWAGAAIVVALAVGPACTARRPEAGGRDGGPRTDSGVIDGCVASDDADGDGIADLAEGDVDIDGDGTPSYLDTDSDGDGLTDMQEHMGGIPCSRPDADHDGIPNWADTDSDNDGLPDAEEAGVYGTNPYNIDTDGDGVTDLGEARGTMTDPLDRTSTIPEGDFFVVLPYLGVHENRTLRFGTNITVADVYFLIDTTGSMQTAIDNVTSSLSSISAQISMRIPNVQMGVGHHDDFPNDNNPFSFDAYGSPGDVPYANSQDITPTLSQVQAALTGLGAGGGADIAESQVEALYQTATGEGGNWTFARGAPAFNLPPRTCPTIPDEPGLRRGYPCFRPGALPIIVLVTDAPWHNGPSFSNAYTGISPAPRTFDETLVALNRIGARFIGVAVSGGPRTEAEAMARGTGTVAATGGPLVYDASGGTVSDAIVTGIETLTGGVVQDVTTRTENVAGNPDDFNATLFIKMIVPVEGYLDGVAGSGYASKDDVAFYGVVPGTMVDFAIDFHNDVRMPASTAQIFKARIIVVGNGVADLDSRNVYIIVPPEGGTVLI